MINMNLFYLKKNGIVYNTEIMNNKIVLDTNIIVAALRSRDGASNKLMSLVGTNKFIPCISIGLILEYEDVLSRKLHKLTKTEIKQFLDYICPVSNHTKIHFLWRAAYLNILKKAANVKPNDEDKL